MWATIVTGLALSSATVVKGQVSYTTAGSIQSENFDSLRNTPVDVTFQTTFPWIDNSTSSGTQTSLPGWYLNHPIAQVNEGGVNQHQRFRASAGGANTGAFYSFGTVNTTERALGTIGANSMSAVSDTVNPMEMALRLNNNTGVTLTDFTLTYDGEQWRNGGSGTANILTFAYGIGATTTTWTNPVGSGFTSVAALNFTAPQVGTTASALDGNAAANRTAGITATVSGISWDPGTDLWLRWGDVNDPPPLGDDGLAIDNLSFFAIAIPVPEPSTYALMGLGSLVFLFRRRAK